MGRQEEAGVAPGPAPGARGRLAIVAHIQLEDERWQQAVPGLAGLARRCVRTVRAKTFDVSILFTSDARQRELNRQFRGKDASTNVLSFPGQEEGYAGDISLAYETVAREAGEQGKSIPDHTTHLIVHGCLHLLGHDHEEEGEAETMEALEAELLARLGIANPYENM